MIHRYAYLLLAALLSPAVTSAQDRADLSAMLAFEGPVDNGVPRGWRSTAPGTFSVDETVVRAGRAAGRIRHTGSTGASSTFTLSIPVSFRGRVLELRGFVRTEEVSGLAGLLMRQEA